MKLLPANSIITKRMCPSDAEAMAEIWSADHLHMVIPNDLRLEKEHSADFVSRMLWRCEFAWSVRLRNNPGRTIGFSFLYNWNKKHKEVYLSGFLVPGYEQKSLLVKTLEGSIEIAKQVLKARILCYTVARTNTACIEALQSIGFKPRSESGGEVILCRTADWQPRPGTSTTRYIYKPGLPVKRVAV